MSVRVIGDRDVPRDRRGAIPRQIWLAAAVMVILVGGSAWLAWRAGNAAIETRTVLLDTGEMTAHFVPLPAASAVVDQNAALARGQESLMAAATATGTAARYGQFSLRRANDSPFLEPRPVWLVTYEGVPFQAQEGCSCAKLSTSSTTLVIDGADGRLLTLFGSSES